MRYAITMYGLALLVAVVGAYIVGRSDGRRAERGRWESDRATCLVRVTDDLPRGTYEVRLRYEHGVPVWQQIERVESPQRGPWRVIEPVPTAPWPTLPICDDSVAACGVQCRPGLTAPRKEEP